MQLHGDFKSAACLFHCSGKTEPFREHLNTHAWTSGRTQKQARKKQTDELLQVATSSEHSLNGSSIDF